jgi:hypothetical protein
MLALCLVIVFLECWKILAVKLLRKFSKFILPSQWNPSVLLQSGEAQITSFVIIVCGVRSETPVFTSR